MCLCPWPPKSPAPGYDLTFEYASCDCDGSCCLQVYTTATKACRVTKYTDTILEHTILEPASHVQYALAACDCGALLQSADALLPWLTWLP